MTSRGDQTTDIDSVGFDSFDALLAASSLGSPAAKAARDQTPRTIRDRLRAHVEGVTPSSRVGAADNRLTPSKVRLAVYDPPRASRVHVADDETEGKSHILSSLTLRYSKANTLMKLETQSPTAADSPGTIAPSPEFEMALIRDADHAGALLCALKLLSDGFAYASRRTSNVRSLFWEEVTSALSRECLNTPDSLTLGMRISSPCLHSDDFLCLHDWTHRPYSTHILNTLTRVTNASHRSGYGLLSESLRRSDSWISIISSRATQTSRLAGRIWRTNQQPGPTYVSTFATPRPQEQTNIAGSVSDALGADFGFLDFSDAVRALRHLIRASAPALTAEVADHGDRFRQLRSEAQRLNAAHLDREGGSGNHFRHLIYFYVHALDGMPKSQEALLDICSPVAFKSLSAHPSIDTALMEINKPSLDNAETEVVGWNSYESYHVSPPSVDHSAWRLALWIGMRKHHNLTYLRAGIVSSDHETGTLRVEDATPSAESILVPPEASTTRQRRHCTEAPLAPQLYSSILPDTEPKTTSELCV